MKPKRPKIPDTLLAAVEFASDRICCVCRRQDKAYQIHHLDNDRKNNVETNLVVLCLEHHDEATVTAGLGRKLTAPTIRKFRAEWYKVVQRRRETAHPAPLPSKGRAAVPEKLLLSTMVDAVAVHEIRKVRQNLEVGKWEQMEAALEPLLGYAEGYGIDVVSELISAAYDASDGARADMPASTAGLIELLVGNALPIGSLVGRSHRRLSKEEGRLFERAGHIGFGLAYDAAKYTKNLGVLDAGCGLLWRVLRYAALNNYKALKADTLDHFEAVESTAKERKNEDAVRWLEFKRLDAMAFGDAKLPKYPADLAAKIRDAE